MPKQVVIYTTKYCPYCTAAKQFLNSKKVPFQEIDVSNDAAMREKLVQLSGQQTVPQIFVDDKPLGGYDALISLYQSGNTL